MRQAKMNRKTQETEITLSLNLDGEGTSRVNTGIGFLDHMLVLFARHAHVDLEITASGDLQVDGHHTTEDVGIVLGQAIARALHEKRGIRRFGYAVVPMDESLASAAIDLSGRACLVFNAEFQGVRVGEFETQLTGEFFRALINNASMTLHLNCLYGTNDHHKIEALFKAFARSFAEAAAIDPSRPDTVLSTKGTL
ncbi:MAG TPA: imidazoleglycerol-phosphate dehydratase HisB [Clostridiales bacterium]|nr:imidazoleglycerol-phosphate dehydratase HisB [Clostridiales bacterium]